MSEKVSIDYSDISTIAIKIAFSYGWKSLIPGYTIYKLMIKPLAQQVIDSATLSQGNDLENIKKIIISGKENSVDELEIRIAKEASVDISTELIEVGIPWDMKFKIGTQGEIIINVKYK